MDWELTWEKDGRWDLRWTDHVVTVDALAKMQSHQKVLSPTRSEIESGERCVVQGYIANPLLYKGLKFDFRVYALVSGCDPLRAYIYN
ncbi:unnamed protein product [Sphagnum balticum]